MAAELTVTLVVHNGRPEVEDCIASLAAQRESLDFQIIIVDNASDDGFGEWLRGRHPGIEYIRNDENLFFTRAQNQALRRAQTPYVLVLNPDIIVHGEALRDMLDYLRSRPAVGVLCAKLLNPDGSFQDPRGRDHRFLWAFWQVSLLSALGTPRWIRRLRAYPDQPDRPQTVDGVTGACMMMPRRALERVGLFDEGYQMYSEENDLCLRMRRAGFEIVYFPRAVMTHVWQAATRKKDPALMKRIEWNSLIYYFRKHRGFWPAAALRMVSRITFPIAAARLRRKALARRPAGAGA